MNKLTYKGVEIETDHGKQGAVYALIDTPEMRHALTRAEFAWSELPLTCIDTPKGEVQLVHQNTAFFDCPPRSEAQEKQSFMDFLKRRCAGEPS
jgi:hypothetical protein